MPSTYTTNLRFELQATGENKASWGQKANTVFELVEESISRYLDVSVVDLGDTTLTALNGASDQSRPMMLKFTGTLTSSRNVIFPSGKSKIYILNNTTTGGFALNIKVGSSTYVLKNGQQKLVYTDGATIWTNDTLITLSSATGRWGIPAYISDTGTMEIGRYIDFHNANVDATDNAVRLDTGGTTTDLYITPSTPVGALGAKVWNAGNDGAGSGLDSDLVDGLHANEIFPQTPNDSKVYGRTTVAGVGGWIETPGPYVGFVAGDMSLGGATAAGILPNRIVFNNNTTLTGTEVASVSETGEIRATSHFNSTTTAAVLSATGAGTIYLRPTGRDDSTQQTTINSSGSMTVAGTITAVQNFQSSSTHAIVGGSSGNVYFRPLGAGNGTNEAYQASDGGMRSGFFQTTGDGANTHSFSNGNGPIGSSSWGMSITSNGSSNVGAARFLAYPGHNAPIYLAFHQPSIAYWGIYNNGPAIGASSYTVSDAKIKSDIHDCDCHDAHNKVKAIRVRSYRKEDGVVSRRSVAYDEMGFIAQELETILPEAVLDVPIPRNDAKGFALIPTESIKATNDRTLLATLWAAVQHQAEMIENLQAEMKAMKGKA